MSRISKKVRAYAADLLSACACEVASRNNVVFIATVSSGFLADEGLDLYQIDQVTQLAALTFREFGASTSIELLVESYLECAARLREGFTPNMDS